MGIIAVHYPQHVPNNLDKLLIFIRILPIARVAHNAQSPGEARGPEPADRRVEEGYIAQDLGHRDGLALDLEKMLDRPVGELVVEGTEHLGLELEYFWDLGMVHPLPERGTVGLLVLHCDQETCLGDEGEPPFAPL